MYMIWNYLVQYCLKQVFAFNDHIYHFRHCDGLAASHVFLFIQRLRMLTAHISQHVLQYLAGYRRRKRSELKRTDHHNHIRVFAVYFS